MNLKSDVFPRVLRREKLAGTDVIEGDDDRVVKSRLVIVTLLQESPTAVVLALDGSEREKDDTSGFTFVLENVIRRGVGR